MKLGDTIREYCTHCAQYVDMFYGEVWDYDELDGCECLVGYALHCPICYAEHADNPTKTEQK